MTNHDIAYLRLLADWHDRQARYLLLTVPADQHDQGRFHFMAAARLSRLADEATMSGHRRGQHLASVLQEGRENANIDAGLGFIWRISVKIVPGEYMQRSATDAVRGIVAAQYSWST